MLLGGPVFFMVANFRFYGFLDQRAEMTSVLSVALKASLGHAMTEGKAMTRFCLLDAYLLHLLRNHFVRTFW